jgi:hypothetical protein
MKLTKMFIEAGAAGGELNLIAATYS